MKKIKFPGFVLLCVTMVVLFATFPFSNKEEIVARAKSYLLPIEILSGIAFFGYIASFFLKKSPLVGLLNLSEVITFTLAFTIPISILFPDNYHGASVWISLTSSVLIAIFIISMHVLSEKRIKEVLMKAIDEIRESMTDQTSSIARLAADVDIARIESEIRKEQRILPYVLSTVWIITTVELLGFLATKVDSAWHCFGITILVPIGTVIALCLLPKLTQFLMRIVGPLG